MTAETTEATALKFYSKNLSPGPIPAQLFRGNFLCEMFISIYNRPGTALVSPTPFPYNRPQTGKFEKTVRKVLRDRSGSVLPIMCFSLQTYLLQPFPAQGMAVPTPYSVSPSSCPCLVLLESTGLWRMPRDATESTWVFLFQESTSASSTGLPSFVGAGSKDPNGYLKWALVDTFQNILGYRVEAASRVAKVNSLVRSSLWNYPCVRDVFLFSPGLYAAMS